MHGTIWGGCETFRKQGLTAESRLGTMYLKADIPVLFLLPSLPRCEQAATHSCSHSATVPAAMVTYTPRLEAKLSPFSLLLVRYWLLKKWKNNQYIYLFLLYPFIEQSEPTQRCIMQECSLCFGDLFFPYRREEMHVYMPQRTSLGRPSFLSSAMSPGVCEAYKYPQELLQLSNLVKASNKWLPIIARRGHC